MTTQLHPHPPVRRAAQPSIGSIAGPDHRGTSAPVSLAGRWYERSRLDGFLDGLDRGPRALEITGEAGIGKSALLRYGVERSRRAGHTVLVARPREEEMSGARVGLWDLFEHTDLLPALVDDTRDRFELGRCLLSWLRDRADRPPILVAVDDLQWLDTESGRALQYALRRLVDERVGLLTTVRSGRSRPDGRSTSDYTATQCETLELGPVDLSTMRAVLTSTVHAISRPLLRRIHQIAGGNPLYGIELARGLGRAVHAEDADLRLPASLQAAIEQRLGAVPAQLHELLDVVAAQGPILSDDLADLLNPVDLIDRLAAAESLRLLVIDEDLRVRFAHPLLASVSYGRMSPLTRRRVHAHLAGRVRDDQQRARHLALSTSEPDEAVAAVLEAAAERTRAAGACDLAAQFARHSVRLTPTTAVVAAHRRALAEVRDLAGAGEPGRALARLDAVLRHLPAGVARAEALVQRFYVEADDYASGDVTLVQALSECGTDTALRGRVLDLLGWLRGMFEGDLPAGIACAREAVQLAAQASDDELAVLSSARLAHMRKLAGHDDGGGMLHALALEERIGAPPLGGGARAWHAKQRLWDGDLCGARGAVERLLGDEAIPNRELERPYRLYDLALVECAAGDFVAARACVDRGVQAAGDADNADAAGWLLFPSALVGAWTGDEPAAVEAAQRLIHGAGRPRGLPAEARARYVLGVLALSQGHHERAACELTRSVTLLGDWGVGHPGALASLPAAIEALAVAGRLCEAAALLDRLESQVARVDTAWGRSAVAAARGILLASTARSDEAVALLEGAARDFALLGFQPESARALLWLGRALLRSGRKTAAWERLVEARARFHSMGAALWEARTAEELERAVPGRAAGAMTQAERRIAALVTRGLKNKEIAQAAFMSVATVEAHLTRIYRKLGIRSRTELVRLVKDGAIAGVE